MRRATSWILGTMLAAAGAAGAQIPDEFTNLKVLPADIAKPELVAVMRGFAQDLGVRCEFCHLGPEGARLEEIDFSSDEREYKRIARQMLQMVMQINQELLPESIREKGSEVRCYTCHRGLAEPRRLEHLLLAEYDEGGVEAVKARYWKLRETFYGHGSYDFSHQPLNVLADAILQQRQDPDGGLAVAEFNVEVHPEALFAHVFLGRLRLMQGDREGALAALRRALELDPENEWLRGQIQQIESPPPAAEDPGS